MFLAWSIPAAFLIGSIPFGLLIARSRGIDIRKHGSGNIGATNVGRVLGRKLGLFCFACDLLKGLLPTLGAGVYLGRAGHWSVEPEIAWQWLAVMAAPVLGHMFCPWIGFKGGKGVATGLGALLGVFPALTIPGMGGGGVAGDVEGLAVRRSVVGGGERESAGLGRCGIRGGAGSGLDL